MRRSVAAAVACCLGAVTALAIPWHGRSRLNMWPKYRGVPDAGDKPILLFFDTRNCGWCEFVREQFLVDPEVVEAVAAYRRFRVADEATVRLPDGREYVSSRWPTLMAFDARGRYLGGVFGWKPVEVIAHELNRMSAGTGTVPVLRELLAQDPTNTLARWRLARALLRFPEERREHELQLVRQDPTGSTTGGKLLRLYEAYETDPPSPSSFRAATDPLVRFHVWWNSAMDEHLHAEDPRAAWDAYQRAWPDCPPDWKPVMFRTLSRLARESPGLREEIRAFLSSHVPGSTAPDTDRGLPNAPGNPRHLAL